MRLITFVFFTLCFVFFPCEVFAEVSANDQQRAQQLFERGVQAARAGELDVAIEAFRESYSAFPHPGTLMNLGLYQLEAGLRVEAHRTLSEFLRMYNALISEQARQEVTRRLTELESALATLTVITHPEGATIIIDGQRRGQTPLAEPLILEPGRYTIEVGLDGHEPQSQTLNLVPGPNPSFEVTLEPLRPEPPPSVRIESGSPGTVVSVDGGPEEPLPIDRELASGEHELRISAPGFLSQTRTIEVPETGQLQLMIELVPLDSDGSEGQGGERRGRTFWRGPWPWVIGGVILAGAGVAIGVTVSQSSDPDWVAPIR